MDQWLRSPSFSTASSRRTRWYVVAAAYPFLLFPRFQPPQWRHDRRLPIVRSPSERQRDLSWIHADINLYCMCICTCTYGNGSTSFAGRGAGTRSYLCAERSFGDRPDRSGGGCSALVNNADSFTRLSRPTRRPARAALSSVVVSVESQRDRVPDGGRDVGYAGFAVLPRCCWADVELRASTRGRPAIISSSAAYYRRFRQRAS